MLWCEDLDCNCVTVFYIANGLEDSFDGLQLTSGVRIFEGSLKS